LRRSPETLIALTWLKQRKLGVRNTVRGCIPAALSTRSPAPAVVRPTGGRRGWPGGAGFLKPSLRGPVPSHHRPHLRQLAGEYHRGVAARPRSGSARWPRAAARRARRQFALPHRRHCTTTDPRIIPECRPTLRPHPLVCPRIACRRIISWGGRLCCAGQPGRRVARKARRDEQAIYVMTHSRVHPKVAPKPNGCHRISSEVPLGALRHQAWAAGSNPCRSFSVPVEAAGEE
jgi:hypothetical protein